MTDLGVSWYIGGMNVPNLKRMTAEEYAQWAQRQETGRFELIDGMVVQMNAERLTHTRVKVRVAKALEKSLTTSGLQGEVLWDGAAVRIDRKTVHEPDVMLRMGDLLPGETIYVPDPIVVVEVLSPSTGPVDTGIKLVNYFTLASVRHYLVINTDKRLVLHYTRSAGGDPLMRSPVSEGEITLDPPGITISIEEIFE